MDEFHELVTSGQVGIVENVVGGEEQGECVASIRGVEHKLPVNQNEKLGSSHKGISCNENEQNAE